MVPPVRTIIVALDLSKSFDTINIRTIINLLQTSMPGTIIVFISNYIKGRTAYMYTTYITTSPYNDSLRLKFLKAATYHSHYVTYTLQILPFMAPVQIMTCADVITITSTHTNTSAAKTQYKIYIQP